MFVIGFLFFKSYVSIFHFVTDRESILKISILSEIPVRNVEKNEERLAKVTTGANNFLLQ